MSLIERAIRRLKSGEESSLPVPSSSSRAEDPRSSSAYGAGEEPALSFETALPQHGAPTLQGRPDPVESPYEAIDLPALKKAGMLLPSGNRSQLSEEFRAIKRPLLENAHNRGPKPIPRGNLIMVTSAMPGEGKTFCAINLALSIALERDHTVLLVDADVAKPREAGFLGLSPRKGLMDMLLDSNLRLGETQIRTNVGHLNVLLAGCPHPHATELLASENMSHLLAEMAGQGPERIVIFDAPPLLVTTEASALARRMGQVVLVVEAGKTPTAAVKSAQAQVAACHVLGLLNKGASAPGETRFNYGPRVG